MTLAWRKEDEALLERLEDELLLERLWRVQAGEASNARPPHPRAAGMIACVRRRPGGVEAVSAALAGNYQPLFARLLPARLAEEPPEFLHHLALYFGNVADALLDAYPEATAEARVRSIAAWLALATEGRYLRSLGAAIAEGALPAAEIERAAEDAPFEPIDALGEKAKDGARDLTPAARAALVALARTAHACELAGTPPAVTAKALRRAERARAAAVEEALAPVLEALAEARARGDADVKGPELFARVAAAWRWSGDDEAIELFAVEQVTPIAWEIQRESRWPDLRRLIGPIIPLVERLAQRIEADPSKIAYAAPCAQVFVFRVEMEIGLDQKVELAERSVRICPSHRNGRLVLASALCDLAIRTIHPAGWYAGPDAYARAEALVARAETLFPSLKKLDDVKQRLAEGRRVTKVVAR